MGKLSKLVDLIDGANESLDMSHAARMQRAKEQGFSDETFYHGTTADFDEFDPALAGSGGANFGEMTFLTSSPDVASGYSAAKQSKNKTVMEAIELSEAARWKYFNAIRVNGKDSKEANALKDDYYKTRELASQASKDADDYQSVTSGANVIPANVKGNILDYDADGASWRQANKNAIEQAKIGGYDGVRIKNVVDAATVNTQKPSDVMAIFDPSNIRSTNAAFDPAKTDSSNLLASKGAGIATGLGATGLALDSEEAEASFIGKAAKTFSKEALDLAEEMTKQGKSRDEIWQATGQMGAPTFKDVDGHWKQEISDKKAKTRNAMKTVKDFKHQLDEYGNIESSLGSAYTHPEMRRAYPDLFKDVNVSQKPYSYSDGASYRNGDIEVPSDYTYGSDSAKADKEYLSHEVQHAIQDEEGFARGGNPADFESDIKSLIELNKLSFSEMDDFQKQMLMDLKGKYGSNRDAFKIYELLAGEAEARNVQTRLDMTMDERVNKAPWETLDVPEDELIVRGSNSGTPSLASVKQADESEAVYDNFITKRASKPPTARVRHRQAQRQAMLAKQEEEAKAAELAAQINESLQAMDFNRQSIEAPDIPAFHTAADWVGKYNRALKGSPAEYLIGAEGLEDYLRKAAYGEAGMLDRAFAVGEAAEVGGAPIVGAKYLKGLTN